MASTLVEWFAGLGHGLVMDELDAWSSDSLLDVVPAQRTSSERPVNRSRSARPDSNESAKN